MSTNTKRLNVATYCWTLDWPWVACKVVFPEHHHLLHCWYHCGQWPRHWDSDVAPRWFCPLCGFCGQRKWSPMDNMLDISKTWTCSFQTTELSVDKKIKELSVDKENLQVTVFDFSKARTCSFETRKQNFLWTKKTEFTVDKENRALQKTPLDISKTRTCSFQITELCGQRKQNFLWTKK